MNILIEKTTFPEWGYMPPIKNWVEIDVSTAIEEGLITESSDFEIQVPILQVILNDDMLDIYHLNEWIVNEGLADADDWYTVNVADCIRTGLIELPKNNWRW